MPPETLAIVGATATGKSALALELARRLEGEIVNADALQVYRGFDIGTAKPGAADRREIPHHLIDILAPEEVYSAGEFARRARAAIEEIAARGRRPILVGGSGLYLRALWAGIAPLPASEPEVRRELEARLSSDGLAALADELARVDPLAAKRIGALDAQRILRALEVYRGSGVPLSEWIARSPFGADRLPMRKLGLTLPRAVLYDRIEARARDMMRLGWVGEVERLLADGVRSDAPAFQAIGYAQIVEALAGGRSMEDAFAEMVTRTRRFAKRQETWFRREPEVEWMDARLVETRLPEIVTAVGSSGGGR